LSYPGGRPIRTREPSGERPAGGEAGETK